MANDNVKIIKGFIECWSSLDVDKITEFFSDNACYHNMPIDPVYGKENIRNFIKAFISTWEQTEWDILKIAAEGNYVFAERLDRTKASTGSVDLPCLGVFELENGKIKLWRDYFDMTTYLKILK